MRKMKAILIHGLNNNIDSLTDLGRCFEDKFEIIYLSLPHHKDHSPLNFHFEDSLKEFKTDLTPHIQSTDFIISYSMGCSYLQYLLENNELHFPMERIIYLSPALKTKMKIKIFSFLPNWFPVPSLAPRKYRLRPFCYWGQYQMLFSLSSRLKLINYPVIYADPKDELIDLKGLRYHAINREYLPYGRHHLTFHSSFYRDNQWEQLIAGLKTYLQRS